MLEFGPLRYWMNTYWGGAVSAAAGCLIFGALPRLRDRGRTRDALLLGAGFGLQLLARPFEAVLLAPCIAIFCLTGRCAGCGDRWPSPRWQCCRRSG